MSTCSSLGRKRNQINDVGGHLFAFGLFTALPPFVRYLYRSGLARDCIGRSVLRPANPGTVPTRIWSSQIVVQRETHYGNNCWTARVDSLRELISALRASGPPKRHIPWESLSSTLHQKGSQHETP